MLRLKAAAATLSKEADGDLTALLLRQDAAALVRFIASLRSQCLEHLAYARDADEFRRLQGEARLCADLLDFFKERQKA